MSRIQSATATRAQAPSHSPPDMTYAPGGQLAKGLGWFSVGLGLAQLFCPKALCRVTGVRRTEVMQCCGLRELATGLVVLSSSRPVVGMWARVAGDVVDLAILGDVMCEGSHADRTRAAESAAAVLGVTALDLLSASQLTAASRLEG